MHQEGEYLVACIYITELEAPTQEIADGHVWVKSFAKWTIHIYPSYWKWIKRGA